LAVAERGGSQVVLTITHAGSRAWRATAHHASLGNKSCIIYVGEVDDLALPLTKAERRHLRAGREGLPVCDQDQP
jgi:hypothetical protein